MIHYTFDFGTDNRIEFQVEEEHTIFRFLGMHLIAQYLRRLDGLPPDWELTDLLRLLGDVHKVNQGLADRIRAASEEDATANSLVIPDAFADAAELGVERHLDKLRPLFSMYLEQ